MTPITFLGFLSSQFLRFGALSIGYEGAGTLPRERDNLKG